MFAVATSINHAVTLRRALTLLVAFTLGACLIEPNPLFNDDPDACPSPRGPGSDECPAECSRCNGKTCTIECGGDVPCNDVELVCPQDYNCVVICDGAGACETASVTCPDLYGCSLRCRGGVAACGGLALTCGDGSCTIECGAEDSSCLGAVVQCGSGICEANCSGTSAPMSMLGCDEACSCAPC